MTDHIFRQYDIRGKVGSELVLSEVYSLVQSIAYYFKEQVPHIKTVAVGADGRVHSPAIKEEVCRALQDMGLDVLFVGVCPTPVLYFSLFNASVDAGLMITASHNGKEYNGIKICLQKESVWGQQIQAIKHIYHNKKISIPSEKGSYAECDMVYQYVAWLSAHFASLKNMPLSAVVDCGNGAAGAVLPLLCKVMEWDHVLLLYSDIDGTYPHHDADPTKEENMADVRAVLHATDIAVGVGLDGDADRITPMTKTGELVLGDKMLALFARSMVENQANLSVVYDIKCSSGLPEALEAMGVVPYVSPTGHSIIKKNMKMRKAALAGELSCHFFFADRYFGYDDGIYAMMRLFEMLQNQDKSLSELLAIFPHKVSTPEIRFSCPESKQEQVMEKVHEYFTRIAGAHIMTLDGIRVELYNGWGILRPSNTQPVLCARFEADTQENLARIQELFMQALESFYERSYLQTIF